MIGTLLTAFRFVLHPISETEAAFTRRKNILWISLSLVALLFLSNIIQVQYTGRNFSFHKPGTLNIFYSFSGTVLLFALFAAGNWCVSTLMGGKGAFRDIWITGAFSLQPMVYSAFACTILSRLLSRTESVLLEWISLAGIIWAFALLLISFMALHHYTLGKTILTFVLTAFAMLIIVFFIMMFLTLMQHLYSFAVTVYSELRFRKVQF